MGCPEFSNRSVVITPGASTKIVDALKAVHESSAEIAKQYRSGRMSLAAGLDWVMSQNVLRHTGGQLGGTPLMNGSTANGASTLVTDGWTGSVANRLKAGDVFTVGSVYSVNPITKQSTGVLQQFVVTEDAASDGSGNVTISISPTIYSSGSRQNVDSLPQDGAAITPLHSASAIYTNNILYHEEAFTLGTADLEMPKGVDFAAIASDPDTGVSIRVVRAYDINNDQFPCRLDVLYGWKAVRPEWACRIVG
jgi:hypothetical protein